MSHEQLSIPLPDCGPRHSVAKRLEKTVVFPQVSGRLLPTCDLVDRRDSTETLRGANSEEAGGDSITTAVAAVPSRSETSVLVPQASALTPRRFGSFPGDAGDSEPLDPVTWGSEDYLESGDGDSWNFEDMDSDFEASASVPSSPKVQMDVVDGQVSASDPSSPRIPKEVVDGQPSVSLQLDPHSPDVVSDTLLDLSQNAARQTSEGVAPFEGFVEVEWHPAKHPPPVLPSSPTDLSLPQQKRRCIFETLISTENNYVATLEHLVQDYDGRLASAEPKILSRDDRRSIFYMLRHLLQVHRTFQISLHDAATHWDRDEAVALAFTACFSRVTVRRVYAAYINNYDEAMKRLKQLEASAKNFSAFIAKTQRHSRFRLPLAGLMVRPIQRFPQYILLLQDLLKNTEAAHPQRFHLQRALSDVQTLATFLNERKAEAHQKSEARSLMRDLRVQSLWISKDQKRRLKLLSVSPVGHERYSEDGTLLSSSDQHLALFNILVVCFVQKRILWSAPLACMSVQSCALTPDMKVHVRRNSVGSTVIQNRSRAASTVDGPVRKRYEDLQALVHDHAVLMQISGLATTLQRRYRAFNELRLQALCTQLQRLIQQKDDENRLTDSSFLKLRVRPPGGEAEDHLFDLGSPAARNAWVDLFMRQKLSEKAWNLPAWVSRNEVCDASDPFTPANDAPLFIASAAVDISRNFGEVNCAMPVCLVDGTILKRYMWCGHEAGGITLFSLYTHRPMVTQNFPCQELPAGGSFWCLELVPGAIEAVEPRHQADMVWAGTNTGHVLVFSLLQQERQRPFLEIQTEGAVIALCYASNRVFAGMDSGLAVIFERDARGHWFRRSPILVGEGPVVKMAPLPSQDGAVLMACEDVLFKIAPDPSTQGFTRDPLHMDGDDHIQDFVVSGEAAWVAFQNSLILRLIHLGSRELLQTVNLNPTISVVDTTQRDFDESVTCLALTKQLLLIGTRAGHLCKLPLQQAMPIPSGPCSVSYHKHHGPVRFIVTFQNMVEHLVRSVDEEEEEDEDEESFGSREEEEEVEEEEGDEENLLMQANSRLRFERKPSVDVTASRRLSLTPLKSKWLSNPNLLLSLKTADEERSGLQFESLMVDIDIDAISEEGSVGSTPAVSRKTSESLADPQIILPTNGARGGDLKVPELKDSEGKMWLDDTLIVTGGLGYCDVKERLDGEFSSEPCLNCWCE